MKSQRRHAPVLPQALYPCKRAVYNLAPGTHKAPMARTTGSSADVTGPRVSRAAQSLFARRGYAAVSMREIAREVGVQAGALYRYTEDKQSLLFSLMCSHMEDLLAAWDTEPQPEGAAARLDAFVRFHIRFHIERADAVFIAYMELRNLTQENFATIEGLRRRYEEVLATILRQGQAEGVFRAEDARIGAMAVIAMLTGVNTWYRREGRLSLGEVEEIYLRMVRGAVAL